MFRKKHVETKNFFIVLYYIMERTPINYKAQRMPPVAQAWFRNEILEALKEYDETGRTDYTETGGLPSRFFLWAMGIEDCIIDKYYPDMRHSFITVRFDNEMPLDEIEDKLKKLKFAWLAVGHARLEIFSSDAKTMNKHAHILSTQANKTRIVRDLSRYFKVPKPNVDVKQGHDADLYNKRYDYILGIKKELKSEAIDADTKYLDEHNVQQSYSYENIM